MILDKDTQGFEGSVPTKRMAFGFSTNNGKLFGILSDGIYRDKISAVIRELGCNAYDAHIVAGNPNPFRVQVPTSMDPTFSVEDEGTGIDPDKIGEIFWTYGDSTKTHNNDTIGALGLGSKSPFAYTKSSFIVKNRFAGNEHTYFCFIDEQGCPAGSEVSVEPTTKPNGVTVELAVRYEDVHAFRSRMTRFYKHWPNKPEFVGDKLDIPDTVSLFSGTNWYYESGAAFDDAKPYAVMGNVPYPIDLSSIPKPSAALRFVSMNTFRLRFPIGSLSFQVSREELSYEANTVKALEAAAQQVVADLQDVMKKEVEAVGTTNFLLWKAFKQKISGIKLNGLEYVGKLIDSKTVFTSGTGDKFTAEELEATESMLTSPGLNEFPVSEIVRYTGGVTALRNRTKVTMIKIDPPKGPGTVARKHEATTSWFMKTLTPRETKFGNQPSDFLFRGYTPEATFFTVPFSAHELAFVLNDVGYNGREAARMLGRNEMFYFVDLPKDGTIAQAQTMLENLLKGTLLAGMKITKLSAHPKFVIPVASSSSTSVAKPRGMFEVRTIKPFDKGYSKYEPVDPKTFVGYYITTTNKTDMLYFREVLPNIIRELNNTKLQNMDKAHFIIRNQEDIDLMIKKGANLTHVRNITTDATKAALQVALDEWQQAHVTLDSSSSNYNMTRTVKWLEDRRSKLDPASPLLAIIDELSKVNQIINDQKKAPLVSLARKIGLTPAQAKPKALVDDMLKAYPMLAIFQPDHIHVTKESVTTVLNYIAERDAA